MKKPISPYTLVRRTPSADESSGASSSFVESSLRKMTGGLADQFAKLHPDLKRSLARSVVDYSVPTSKTTKQSGTSEQEITKSKRVTERAGRLIKSLVESPDVVSVGILDLGAWLSGLPVLLEVLNKAQAVFRFVEIQAPVPSGLLKASNVIELWAAQHLGRSLKKTEKAQLEGNVISDDFFRVSEDIRKGLHIDFVVGVCAAKIACSQHDSVDWNLFATHSDHSLLISVADLRGYAAKAKRPFEAALGSVVVSQLLVAIEPNLFYHDDSGCLFDFNEDRKSIVRGLKLMMIEDSCLQQINEKYRTSVMSLVAAIRSMELSK
jgi:hypothetical protein